MPVSSIEPFGLESEAAWKADEMSKSYAALTSQNIGGSKLREIDTSFGRYLGPIVRTDEFHALQSLGQQTFVIHRNDLFDKEMSHGDKTTSIKYCNGRGTQLDVTKDHGIGR
jgi:hypothetical protein